MTPQDAELTCSVCGEAMDRAMSAECNACGQRYHLNQRNDVVAKDCGAVWIDEQYMALQFACNACLAEAAGEPAKTVPGLAPVAARQRRRYRRRA